MHVGGDEFAVGESAPAVHFVRGGASCGALVAVLRVEAGYVVIQVGTNHSLGHEAKIHVGAESVDPELLDLVLGKPGSRVAQQMRK